MTNIKSSKAAGVDNLSGSAKTLANPISALYNL